MADALKSGHAERFVLQCFDLLYLDGINLMGADLTDRKAVLQRLLGRKSKTGQIRYSEHLAGDGARMLAEACRLGLEGIISKRADRPYRSGRHDDWLKSKCIQTDEFVIVGYVESSASTNAIGALVVGYYDRKRLIYAGRVGTGFTQSERGRPASATEAIAGRIAAGRIAIDGSAAKGSRMGAALISLRKSNIAPGRRTIFCGTRPSRVFARTSRRKMSNDRLSKCKSYEFNRAARVEDARQLRGLDQNLCCTPQRYAKQHLLGQIRGHHHP